MSGCLVTLRKTLRTLGCPRRSALEGKSTDHGGGRKTVVLDDRVSGSDCDSAITPISQSIHPNTGGNGAASFTTATTSSVFEMIRWRFLIVARRDILQRSMLPSITGRPSKRASSDAKTLRYPHNGQPSAAMTASDWFRST